MKKFIIGAVLVLAGLINASAQGAAPKPCLDFYGSGRTSFAVKNSRFAFKDGSAIDNIVWRLRNNGGAGENTVLWGLSDNDIPAPGYFDSDNRADIAVWRWRNQTQAYYFIRPTAPTTPPNSFLAIQWGKGGDSFGERDYPTREADYDGDGRDDLTVLRRVDNKWHWYYLRSSNNTFAAVVFGYAPYTSLEDQPLPGADYTGDGRADIGVIRRTDGGGDTYLIGDSNTGALVLTQQWGDLPGDIYVTGDYLGDSRADFAVWRGVNFPTGATRDGYWYIQENGGNNRIIVQFGIPSSLSGFNDIPVCGDYNGDGKSDIAVYRYTNNTFYWLNSPSLTSMGAQQFGQPGDYPLATVKNTSPIF
ncbi:MAG TPA: VCBS repeat-containing protein [Pyrinomonadaceae bacterium]